MQEGGSFNCFCVFVSGFSIFRLLDKMLRHAKMLPQLGDSEELEKLISRRGTQRLDVGRLKKIQEDKQNENTND